MGPVEYDTCTFVGRQELAPGRKTCDTKYILESPSIPYPIISPSRTERHHRVFQRVKTHSTCNFDASETDGITYLLSPTQFNALPYNAVFLFCPWTLVKARAEHLVPPFEDYTSIPCMESLTMVTTSSLEVFSIE